MEPLDHFSQLSSNITETIVTHHFKRDAPLFDIALVTGSDHSAFTHLHKYEETIDGHHIFRALKDKTHYVYAIDKAHRLIFLRAFHNFKEYKKFLDDKRTIAHMIEHAE
jgi:hypothetical protein